MDKSALAEVITEDPSRKEKKKKLNHASFHFGGKNLSKRSPDS